MKRHWLFHRSFPSVVRRRHQSSNQQTLECSFPLSSSCRSYHHHHQEDDAFVWARTHGDAARACLQVPPPPPPNNNNDDSLSSLKNKGGSIIARTLFWSSLEDYWAFRRWDFSAAAAPSSCPSSFLSPEQATRHAQSLVSHVLSAPLTLARWHHHYHHHDCVQDDIINNNNNNRDKQKPHVHWCCVGARSEATLPVEYWREFLFAIASIDNGTSHSVTLDFVGPDVATTTTTKRTAAAKATTRKLTWHDSSLELKWLHRGYLHDLVATKKPPPQAEANTWDGFVLFNPGIGHEHLTEQWLPTLEYMLSTDKPLLLTAHSKLDADRDWAVLQQRLVPVGKDDDDDEEESLSIPALYYHPNPFASRITYQDPLSPKQHLVRPNQYATYITRAARRGRSF